MTEYATRQDQDTVTLAMLRDILSSDYGQKRQRVDDSYQSLSSPHARPEYGPIFEAARDYVFVLSKPASEKNMPDFQERLRERHAELEAFLTQLNSKFLLDRQLRR